MRDAAQDIRAVADRIVADLPRGESFDFVRCMAGRVPSEMIAAILGLPQADASYFSRLVYDLALGLSPVYPQGEHDKIESAARQLFDYLHEELRSRIPAPREDLLSALVGDWHADQVIPFESLVNQVLGLVLGGSDTTRAAFGNLVSLLLQHPKDWQAIRRDPGLIPGAVSEGLRYDPSVGTIPRLTLAPMQIGGAEVPAGAFLSLSTVSALRDPDLYNNPDCFDIRRKDHPRLNMVFGNGPHRCIGEMLARLEMQEGLAALVAAAPRIVLEWTPELIGFGGIRQITPMQVRIA
jgi:cytochrome P450